MQRPFEERFHAAVDLYNRGDYLAAQEVLEGLLVDAEPRDQPLVRAVAILATAMHLHFNRGGGRGVVNLLRQFLLTIEDDRSNRLGIDVSGLFEAVEAYLGDLQERRKPGASFFDRWLAPRVSYHAT